MLATVANEVAGDERPMLLSTLAAAQAAGGQFELAVAPMERALALARGGSATRYIPEFRERLALYKRGLASVEGAAPSSGANRQ